MHTAEHYINMEGVIPNSKVVILPPSKAGDPWKRELFLRPGEWIPWVTLTVVVGTALLAVIVLVLHLNEKVRLFVCLFLWPFSDEDSCT
jgi:integrin alpha FG-GAP repeat containing protein 1